MITTKKYPVLEWTAYRPNFLPDELRFAGFNQKSYDYMANSKAFQNFFSQLGFDYYQGSTLADKIRKENALPSFFPHKHFYLKETIFHKVDSDQNFRMKMWSNRNTPSGSGSIMFIQGGFYMYRILNEFDSQTFKKSNFTDCEIPSGSRYFAICLFSEDNFIGFEEGTILPNGNLQISTDGYYSPFQEVGQYISFVSIALTAYFTDAVKSKKLNPNEGLNQSSQPIIYLD